MEKRRRNLPVKIPWRWKKNKKKGTAGCAVPFHAERISSDETVQIRVVAVIDRSKFFLQLGAVLVEECAQLV